MTEQRKTDVARFYDAEAAEYHRMYQRENLETSERYPANYFRLQILVRRLASLGAIFKLRNDYLTTSRGQIS